MNFFSKTLLNLALRATILLTNLASGQIAPAIAGQDGTAMITLHAEGAQIYECKPVLGAPRSEIRAMTWQFREPVAALILNGKSVGRHYAGPSWDYLDGSGVKGKVASSAPGATSNDIPWLKLDVVYHHNNGIMSDVTSVQRINTKGGVAEGSCERAGEYLSVPYSADYVFLRGGM